jgi:hypothetical protein
MCRQPSRSQPATVVLTDERQQTSLQRGGLGMEATDALDQFLIAAIVRLLLLLQDPHNLQGPLGARISHPIEHTFDSSSRLWGPSQSG